MQATPADRNIINATISNAVPTYLVMIVILMVSYFGRKNILAKMIYQYNYFYFCIDIIYRT